MPKPTFYHLPAEKQKRVLAVCKEAFESKPIHQASVANIVKTLDIARGSFYQYFESLEEAFFTVLHSENVDIHSRFARLLVKHEGDFFAALENYGELIAAELYSPGKQALYRNRFLYWSPELEQGWAEHLKKEGESSHISKIENQAFAMLKAEKLSLQRKEEIPELMRFTQAVVHQLIQRSFRELWTADVFLKHYQMQVHWMKTGLSK